MNPINFNINGMNVNMEHSDTKYPNSMNINRVCYLHERGIPNITNNTK